MIHARCGSIWKMIGVGVGVIAAHMATAQDISPAISPAEKLLFQTQHLQNIHRPMVLTYAYQKVSNVEPGFDDQVHVDVTKINQDGSAAASLRFLSGNRKLDISEVENLHGNPALLGFLERDIGEMKRLTNGSKNYFRKRIRLALAGAAHVRRVFFTYDGKQLEGQEVSVQPYRNDPLHERFEKYVNKSYVFVISNGVPGSVYQVRSSLSGVGSGPQEQMVMDETLTLIRDGKS